jgi:HlyD family secretion protein
MRTIIRAMAPWLAMLGLAGCTARPPTAWQGYIEGEFVYVGGPLGGQLTNLAVRRGTEVQAGQMLFELEGAAEAEAAREAEGRLAQAGAHLDNLNKGRRPTEIASLESQLQSAQSSLELSTLELERQTKLKEAGANSLQEMDAARSRREVDLGRVNSLKAELETARLGGRTDEIKAAEADVQTARAALGRARWAVAQKRQTAPAAAWVQDTLYREGEFVVAGFPVVALLPPANIKVRFFVPQAQLVSVRPGVVVSVNPDGAPAPLKATVNYISARAEFTPPVIYSKENRAKLVFMVEAVFNPAEARELRPGQPVDVRLVL